MDTVYLCLLGRAAGGGFTAKKRRTDKEVAFFLCVFCCPSSVVVVAACLLALVAGALPAKEVKSYDGLLRTCPRVSRVMMGAGGGLLSFLSFTIKGRDEVLSFGKRWWERRGGEALTRWSRDENMIDFCREKGVVWGLRALRSSVVRVPLVPRALSSRVGDIWMMRLSREEPAPVSFVAHGSPVAAAAAAAAAAPTFPKAAGCRQRTAI